MSRNELELLGNKELNMNSKLSDEYKKWRLFRQDSKENYFILPKELIDYLPSIKARAINLYLLYCFMADNDTGISYPSVNYCANKLEVSSRSIDSWNSILQEFGLIYRSAETHSSKTTYLLPISDYYYVEDNLSPVEYIEKFNENENINKKVDGVLSHIFHLNQWNDSGSTDEVASRNLIALVYKRSYNDESLSKTFNVFKSVLFLNINTSYQEYEINLDSEDFTDNFYQFESPIEDNIFSVPVKGIAINNTIAMTSKNGRENIISVNIADSDSKQLNKVLRNLNLGYNNLDSYLTNIDT